jgi:hypothetical protein
LVDPRPAVRRGRSDLAPHLKYEHRAQGENDYLVPAGPVHDFVDDAQTAGLTITLVTVPCADHVFDATPLSSQIYVETTLG